MSMLIFYREQAAQQQGEADAALLDNVRNRCQRAADAWRVLADRIERADSMRATRLAENASLMVADPDEDPDLDAPSAAPLPA
jgi:hypothetical protein